MNTDERNMNMRQMIDKFNKTVKDIDSLKFIIDAVKRQPELEKKEWTANDNTIIRLILPAIPASILPLPYPNVLFTASSFDASVASVPQWMFMYSVLLEMRESQIEVRLSYSAFALL